MLRCVRTKLFWEEGTLESVEKMISKVTPVGPGLVRLWLNQEDFMKRENIFTDICFLHAKRLIAMFWKCQTTGSADAAVSSIRRGYSYIITYRLRGKQDVFEV